MSDDGARPNPAVDWITIEGFRSIRSLERLELRPVNILIGANGSGKSKFVEAFSFLRAISTGRLRRYVRWSGGAARLLHFGPHRTPGMTLHLSFAEDRKQYRIDLRATSVDGLEIAREATWSQDSANGSPQREERLSPDSDGEAAVSRVGSTGVAGLVRRRLDSLRVYHFHDTSVHAPLRRTANVHDLHFLQADGSNLPAFLHLLRKEFPDSYEFIRKTVRLAMPFLGDFVLQPFGDAGDAIRLQWTHRDGSTVFDVSAMSDGALRFVALATLFLQPVRLRPRLLLLDEPELGLHPYAIELLAAMTRSVSKGSQVVLATQSPAVVDHFEPEQILVSERHGDYTTLRRVEPDALGRWLEEYSLGELWEKGYLGGGPHSYGEGRESA